MSGRLCAGYAGLKYGCTKHVCCGVQCPTVLLSLRERENPPLALSTTQRGVCPTKLPGTSEPAVGFVDTPLPCP